MPVCFVLKYLNMKGLFIMLFVIVSISCKKIDNSIQPPSNQTEIEESIKFSTSVDNLNGVFTSNSDSLKININVASKIPSLGLIYNIDIIRIDLNKSIYTSETESLNNSLSVNTYPYNIGKTYSISISVKSKKTPTNISSNTIKITRNRVFKNYIKPSIELQSSDINLDIFQMMIANGKYFSPISVSATSFLDINGDGIDDIFIQPVKTSKEQVTGQVYISRNGKYEFDNTFIDSAELPNMYLARKSLVGDFNNDSIPDIFLAGFGPDISPFPGESNTILLSSNGKYKRKIFSDIIGGFHGACSGDIDKDGDLDIFALSNTKSHFLLNDGKGNFVVSTKEIDITALSDLFTSELFDINKDGYLDLILGGHEFIVSDPTFQSPQNILGATRIYWGNSSGKYNSLNVSYLPVSNEYGVVLDFDFADIDNDGNYEIAINRTGGKFVNNTLVNFYIGWSVQIVKFDGTKWVDKSNSLIENNTGKSKEIVWLRFQDIDANGKLDLFSMKINDVTYVRWEVENGKLVKKN